MSEESQPSRITSTVQSAVAGAKQAIGKLVGSEEMEHEGAAGREEAKADYAAAQSQDFVEGTKARLGGAALEAKGAVTGDTKTSAKGKVVETVGSAKQAASNF